MNFSSPTPSAAKVNGQGDFRNKYFAKNEKNLRRGNGNSRLAAIEIKGTFNRITRLSLGGTENGNVGGVFVHRLTGSVDKVIPVNAANFTRGWGSGPALSLELLSKMNSVSFGNDADEKCNYKINVEKLVLHAGYFINYELNGGTNSSRNLPTYRVSSGAQLFAPGKYGYKFDGWFDNAEFSGTAISSIPAGIAKDYTLYAKWTPLAAKPSKARKTGNIVGYAMGTPSDEQLDKLTHIVLSFVVPDIAGNVDFSNMDDWFKDVADRSYERGVEVIIALGGGAGSRDFPAIVKEPIRTAFISNIVEFVEKHKFDGVDIDWEFPGHNIDVKTGADRGLTQQQLDEEIDDFEAFVVELRAALGETKRLSFAIGGGTGHFPANKYPKSVYDALDALHIMTYDYWTPFDHHAPMQGTKDNVSHFINSGLIDREKIFYGVPFYGRQRGAWGNARTYAAIIAANPSDLSQKDFDDISFYDGIPQIREKTLFALENEIGGVMIWEIGGDVEATSEYSLLRVIWQETQSHYLCGDGHNFTEWKITTAAGCETAGEKTEMCSRCQKLGSKTETIEAAHDWSDWKNVVPATCMAKATRDRDCKRCPIKELAVEFGNVNPLAHDWNNWTKIADATCVARERQRRTCKHNAEHIEHRDYGETNPNAHVWGDWERTKEPSDTEKGEQRRDCTRATCNAYEIQAIDMTSINGAKKSGNRYGIKFALNPVAEKAEISVVLSGMRATEAVAPTLVIYDMTGNVVFECRGDCPQSPVNNAIIWDLRNNAGRFVANGTYLVVAEAKDRNGKIQVYSAKLGVRR